VCCVLLAVACDDEAFDPRAPDAGSDNSIHDEFAPTRCTIGEDSVVHDSDWLGTGVEVTELTPTEWDPDEHPTLLFSHANDLLPQSYVCYQYLLAERCVRTVMPRQWNTEDGELPHLGWEARALRWESTLAVYDELTEQQNTDLIFIGGHSIGAYTTLLAAGADSFIGEQQAGNCEVDDDEVECEPLDAAGYVIISGWPAQRAAASPPFWFAHDAFADLGPSRFVAYGQLDASSGDPCLQETPPACRGDSYWIDAPAAADLNLRHVALEGFDHLDFTCNGNWEEDHAFPEAIEEFVASLGDWIRQTIEAGPIDDDDDE